MTLLLALIPLAIWSYLLLGRGFFWLAREEDETFPPLKREGRIAARRAGEGSFPGIVERSPPAPPVNRAFEYDQPRGARFTGWATSPLQGEESGESERWPSVTAVVPARNEADAVGRSLGSLLAQDYPGAFRIVLVDDQSEDGTGEIARSLANDGRLSVLDPSSRPAGWTGKLWAVSQGIAFATREQCPDYLWLTDADIAHAPDTLRSLVVRSQHGKLVLASLMAKLSCSTAAERFFVPAFVYFFRMLYPFAWVNDARRKIAAAAGGCMLVRRAALESAGGIASIRGAIIDDCALGTLMKCQGPIWLGLTERSVSFRLYPDINAIRGMVARSAYAQLGYSPLALAGMLLGLLAMFAAPVLLALFGGGMVRIAGLAAWLLMAVSFTSMLRFYGRSPLWGLALPLIGLAYAAFTLDSALQHWRGRGGMWKGRAQAMARQ